MRVTTLSVSRLRALGMVLVCTLILAACGPLGSDPQPATSVDVIPEVEGDTLSVGDVLSPLDTAWTSVRNERVTTNWGNNLTDSTPAPAPSAPGQDSIAMMVAPDSRYLLNRIGGVTMEEVIAVDGVVYVRGPRMIKAIAPHADPEAWVKVDPTTLPADEPVRFFLLNQLRPAQAPFSNLSQEAMSQVAEDVGEVEIQGKTCRAYTFTEDSADMGQWELEISVDTTTGLPCRLVRTLDGTYQAVSIFEYNVTNLEISRPATWNPAPPTVHATPVVGPLGLPTTGPLPAPGPATPVSTPSSAG